jgi:hypothetical protein
MKASTVLAALVAALSWADALAQPTITKEPADASVSLGATAQFTVSATSTSPPITYQWWFQNTAIEAALNPSAAKNRLSLTNVSLAHAGPYFVVISDQVGSITSRVATLTVDPTFIKITGPEFLQGDVNGTFANWVDYDADGWLEVVVAQLAGSGPARPFNTYKNNRDGTFTAVTNLLTQTPGDWFMVTWADFDGDGDLDGLAAGASAPALFLNQGKGEFSKTDLNRYTTANGVNPAGYLGACADYDGDGRVDVAFRHWPWGGPHFLLHNVGGGRFDVFTGAPWNVSAYSTAMVWVDYDGDRDLDLYIAAGEGKALLFQNQGDGGFIGITSHPIVDVAAASYDAGWGDYDNDGDLDVYLPHESVASVLYRNLGGGQFEGDPHGPVLDVKLAPVGASWGDYDNDGYEDLFIGQRLGRNRLFHNSGDGTFTEVLGGSPVNEVQDNDWRGVWADYNNDGFLDLLVWPGSGPTAHQLYQNNLPQQGNGNHWLKVQPRGVAASSEGIGAIVRVKATIGGKPVWQMRQVGGQPYCSELVVHFGLGEATTADLVRIEWPSGNVQELTDVQADQALKVTESVGITPTRPTASLNGAVTLARATVTGAAYQWRHDGVDLAGQTNRSLALTNITAEMAGRYSVVFTTETVVKTNFVYLHVDTQFTKILMGDDTPSWGCAWGDYNNDDYPDLFVAEGTFTSSGACSLYRNNRDGTLTRVTAGEAGEIVSLRRSWMNPVWGDYDNDGRVDLFVTEGRPAGAIRSVLWHNLGDGYFGDATGFAKEELFGVPIWGDYNRDGQLDLLLVRAYYDPPTWDNRNALYLNNGDGAFINATGGELFAFRGQLEGGSAGDMDGDGDLDLCVTGGTGVALFENDGAGDFHRVASGFPAIGGYLITPSWADYDNDGKLDVFVATYDQSNRLLHNAGNGQWTSLPLGAALETSAGMWADYDNDGDLDLYITRGQGTTTTNLFFSNNGDGTFAPITTGSLVTDQGRGAGCAWADYDNNGFLDLFVTSHAGFPEVLYRNHGNSNHWLSFKLVGTASNRSAIGAKVRVQARVFGKNTWQMREVGGANRHQNDLRPHFGLGDAIRATTVRIEWPSGSVQELSNVSSDQFLTVWEPPFVTAAVQPDGTCVLNIRAEPNRAWQIQASSDLANWETLATVTPTTKEFEYGDTAAGSMICRFYRLRGD